MKYKSLKTRVLIWFGTIISIIFLLFSFALYYFFDKSIITSIHSKLDKKALDIQNGLLIKKNIEDIKTSPLLSDTKVAVFENNRLLFKTKNLKKSEIGKYIKNGIDFSIRRDDEHIKAVLLHKFKKPFNGAILLIQDDIDEKSENLIDTMLVLNPILLVLMIFLANRLIDKILSPVKDITKAAKEINIKKLATEIKQPQHDDELKELVDAFNEMTVRLQSGFEQIKRFNSDVSHELKTPLTVIKGEANIALRHTREPEEYRKSLQVISYEANQMQQLIDNLLLLVRYSKANIQQSFKEIEIDILLINILEKYEKIAKNKNINLKLKRFEALSLYANAQLVTVIFSNLIDNAIKYSPNGSDIEIFLYKNDKIHFIVKDNGTGIPEDKIDKITQRFYRVDESRNKEIQGFGLGLSLVKNAVELHNGSYTISSSPNKGTKVEIIL